MLIQVFEHQKTGHAEILQKRDKEFEESLRYAGFKEIAFHLHVATFSLDVNYMTVQSTITPLYIAKSIRLELF